MPSNDTRRPPLVRACEACGTLFRVWPYQVRRGQGRFCSHTCGRIRFHRRSLASRFWDHVAVRGPDDCWLWTGFCTNQGYGKLSAGGRGVSPLRAHRVSYELHSGPIPPGRDVCHSCDNPSCVNPAHLFLGTRTDNMRDAKDKGRLMHGDAHIYRLDPTRVARGEGKPLTAKLNEDQVRAMRQQYADGVSQRTLADIYHVSASAVSLIVTGRRWKHIN